LSGQIEHRTRRTLTAATNAGTNAFTLDFPATGAHFVKLELRNNHGKLLSRNFYWHARNENDLRQLNSLPQVQLLGDWKGRRRKREFVITGKVTNPGKTPARAVRLTLRDAKTGERVLSVYYHENYFSLLPGESREFRIESTTIPDQPEVGLTGWNIVAGNLPLVNLNQTRVVHSIQTAQT